MLANANTLDSADIQAEKNPIDWIVCTWRPVSTRQLRTHDYANKAIVQSLSNKHHSRDPAEQHIVDRSKLYVSPNMQHCEKTES